MCAYIYIHNEIYFKDLAHTVVGTGKSEVGRAGSRLETDTSDTAVVRENALFSETSAFAPSSFS